MNNPEMTEADFDYVLDKRLKQIEEVLAVKAKEYVRNEDRLHNFNKGAEKTGMSRERVLWEGFALKHLISIDDMLDDLDDGKVPSEELVEEKIGDIINYAVLLEACFKDRIWKRDKIEETRNIQLKR